MSVALLTWTGLVTASPRESQARDGGTRPVTGVVTEAETGAPLPGVHVALVSGEDARTVTSVLSDEVGRFALPGEVGRIYRLRAERVGLATFWTPPFTLQADAQPRRLLMGKRAVAIEGLTVETGLRLCSLDPAEGGVVQRWWDEVRKALESAAVARRSAPERFRLERVRREWTRDLGSIHSERVVPLNPFSPRPFLAVDPEVLSALGYVRGEPGQRVFLAPDAEVLFSRTFLNDHCLGVAPSEGRPGALALAVKPLPSREVPEIEGILTVDTLASELRSFDFRYVNLPGDLPAGEVGGHLSFAYLPSGWWLVSDWWVRMPLLRLREPNPDWDRFGAPSRGAVVGYVDDGGRVAGVGGDSDVASVGEGRGVVRGTVWNRLTGGTLAAARVSLVGTRLSTGTGPNGAFELDGVPAGRYGVTFHHAEVTRLGLPSPVVEAVVEDGDTISVEMETPNFTTALDFLCPSIVVSPDREPEAILTGTVFSEDSAEPVGLARVRARWLQPGEAGRVGADRVQAYAEMTAGSDGRYVFCNLPGGVTVRLAVRVGEGWRDAGSIRVEKGVPVGRDLRPGGEVLTIVRGSVADATRGAPLASAIVSLITSEGGTVVEVSTDPFGRFRIITPGAGSFLVSASVHGYAPATSAALSLAEGEVADIDIGLTPLPETAASVHLEGLLVTVDPVSRIRDDLSSYGVRLDDIGRRYIDRKEIERWQAAADFAEIVAWQSLAQVTVTRSGSFASESPLASGPCVSFARARVGSGPDCALVMLNGVRVPPNMVGDVAPETLEAIVLLTPAEATTVYGSDASGGAVVLVSKVLGQSSEAIVASYRNGILAELRPVIQAWKEAWKKGAAEELAALYAEDAVVLLPDEEPLRGRQMLRARLREVLAARRVMELVIERFDASEGMATTDGHIRVEILDGAGARRPRTGTAVTVFQRRGATWLIRAQVVTVP